MNVMQKKNSNKTGGRPSIPQANPVFAKPANFLNHFAATKKPSLLNSTYPSRPNYKYESPWIQRSAFGESTAVSELIELTGGGNFRGVNNEADSIQTTSLKKSDSTSSPFSSSTIFSRQRSVLPVLQTPISLKSNRKLSAFVSGTSSSYAKERKATPKSTGSGTTSTSNQARVIVEQIIFPNTFVDNQHSSKLLETIQTKFPGVNQTSLNRKYFNDEQGIIMIKSLHLPECSSIEFLILRKYYTLAAAAALLKYVEYIENVTLASSSVPMEYQAVEKMMLIDFETMHHLELILSQANLGVSHSLFGILNHCLTFGGQKRLRSAILQPSCVHKDLEDRFDSVNELVDKPDLLHNIQSALVKVPDVESLLRICFISETRKPDDSSLSLINYIILLKTTLDMIPSLYNILSRDAKTKFFEKVTKCLQDPRFVDISSEINKMLCKDTKRVKGYSASQFQRCFAIKPDINGLLDVARYTYSELVSDFQSKVAELANDYEIPLKCQNTGAKGFHIQLNVKGQRNFKLDSLPKVFIQVQRSRNIVTMITEELIFINERIKQALQEIQIMTNVLLQELFHKIRENSGCLYNLCDRIAELDLIVSLARVSSSSGYVRPTFGSKLVLKSSRHPILDVVKTSVPIPNDVKAANMNNFHIITGPNMGGKSIYIKQVALIQIMAQIGCYVPAESAELKLIDRLFSRIGFEDSIECNASTFVLELREIQHIIRSATKSSLIIIDEFGRGTSSEEGAAIAWAVSEVFIHSPVYVFFATHFLFVTELQEFYPNVTVWNFSARVITLEDSSRPRLEFTHKLVPGVMNLTNYGLKLAEMTALSNSVKETATEIAQSLTKEKIQKQDWQMTEEDRLDVQLDRICCQLMCWSLPHRLDLDKIEEIILESNILKAYNQQNILNNKDIGENSEKNILEDVDLNATYGDQDTTCNDDNTEVSENSRENDRLTLNDSEFDHNERELVDFPDRFAPHPFSSQDETRNCLNDNTKKISPDVSAQDLRTNPYSRHHENALNAIRQYESPNISENSADDSDENDCIKDSSLESRNNHPPEKRTETQSFKINETTETQSFGDMTEQFSYADTTQNIINPKLLETSALNHSFTPMHTASWNTFWENSLLKCQHQPANLKTEELDQENKENMFFDLSKGRPDSSCELDSSNISLMDRISPIFNQSVSEKNVQINSYELSKDERYWNSQSPSAQLQPIIDEELGGDQTMQNHPLSPTCTENSLKSPVSWKTPANDSSVERKYSNHNTLFFQSRTKGDLQFPNELQHETVPRKQLMSQFQDQNQKSRLTKDKHCYTDTATLATDQNYGKEVILSPLSKIPRTEYEPQSYSRETQVDLQQSNTTKSPIDERCETPYDSKARSPLKETGSILYPSKRIATYSNHDFNEQTNQSYIAPCERENYYSDSSSPKTIKKLRRSWQNDGTISPVTSEDNGKHSMQVSYDCCDKFRFHPKVNQQKMRESSKLLHQRQAHQLNNIINTLTSKDTEKNLTEVSTAHSETRGTQDHYSNCSQTKEAPQCDQSNYALTPQNNENNLARVNGNFLDSRGYYDSPRSKHQRIENSKRLLEEEQALLTNPKFYSNTSYYLPSPVHLDECLDEKEGATGSDETEHFSRNDKSYTSRVKTKNFPVHYRKHGPDESSLLTYSNAMIESEEPTTFNPRYKQSIKGAISACVPPKFHPNSQNFIMSFGNPNEFNVSHQFEKQPTFFKNNFKKYSVQQSEEDFESNRRQPTETVPNNEPLDYNSTFSRPVGSLCHTILNYTQIYPKKRVTFQEQPETISEDSPRSINSFILSQESQFLLQNNSASNQEH